METTGKEDRAGRSGTRTYRVSRRAGWMLVGLVLLCVAAQAWLGRELYRQHGNTLHANGRWTSGKRDVDMGIAGAATYLVTRRGLQHNRLNLGPWYGFHELRTNDRFDFREASCVVTVPDRGYVVVRVDAADAAFTGVRLSRDPAFPSLAFRASDDGAFTWQAPIEGITIDPVTNRCRLRRSGAVCAVDVNGREVAQLTVPDAPLRLGFRGGFANATVDDVRIVGDGGTVLFEETFRNTAHGRVGWLLFGGLVLLWGAVAYGLRRLGRRLRAPVGFYVLGANLTVVLCFGLYCATDFLVLSGRHVRKPTESRYRRTVETGAEVQERLAREYPKRPDPSVRRVVFLGSSQTWGSGARTRAETFIARIERALNEGADGGAARGTRVQCINAAISGAYSTHMLDGWRDDWHRWKPEVVVMNMSHNDRDPDDFRRNLTELAEHCRTAGVKLLFSLEPTSPEHDTAPIERNHAVMREVGATFGVPVVDLHGALLRELDRGFLWWDVVHLTSFGHQLAAEHLTPPVRRLLGRPPLRQ